MESSEIFNYVRKLELENGALKTALAEYQEELKDDLLSSPGLPDFMMIPGLSILESVLGDFAEKLKQSVEKSASEPISENITPNTTHHDIYIICD